MRKKNVILSAAVLILAAALISFWAYFRESGVGSEGESSGGEETLAPVTREPLPNGAIVVPEAGAADIPKNVAIPEQVSSAPNFTLRQFSLVADKGSFSPDTVIVNVGDTVKLTVAAVDRDYDFSQPDFGFNVPVEKGATRSFQFGATTAGQFKFFCASCGGPEKGPVGTLVIVPRE